MKRKYIFFSLCTMLLALASCVKDEGNNEPFPINELEVSGMEDVYNMIGYTETLSISVSLEGSLSGADENQFDYQWYICNGDLIEETHEHTVIGTEKNLEYPVNIESGNYNLYFRAVDKSTGMLWERGAILHVFSPFVRGFYLWGDKPDGVCGMDFVSMIDGRDTTMIADIFENTKGMRGAKNLIFTGDYISDHVVNLWAVAENGAYSLEHDPSLGSFGVLEDVALDKMVFPTIEVTRPLNFVDIIPHAFGSKNTNRARSWRVLLTDGDAYFGNSLLTPPEAYGNPVSRYSASTTELYKPSPYVFYKNNAASVSAVAFFDETNHKFAVQNAAYYSASFTMACNDSESPFWFDQNNYTPVRNLVYGENGYSGGYSYALMNDADGNFYVYKFVVNSYGANGISKSLARSIDKSVAIGFDEASHYTFFSMQPIILYSVGDELWAYNYMTNNAKKVDVMDGEITYLAMDYHSNDTPTDFIVATYSDGQKGTVYKYTIEDNPNDIVVKPHEYRTASYPWKTDLRVVKIEYRNSSK